MSFESPTEYPGIGQPEEQLDSSKKNQAKTENIKKKTGWLERNKGKLRTMVVGATLSAGSLVAQGADKSPAAPENTEGPTTKQVESESRHTQEDQKQALRKAFKMIAGSAMGKTTEGNLVVHIGGQDYYELDTTGLQSLMEKTNGYIDKCKNIEAEQDSPLKVRKQMMIDKVFKIQMTENIMDLGKKVAVENLPGNLKQMEQVRKETIEGMSEPILGEASTTQSATTNESTTRPSNEDESGPTGKVTPDKDL
jgi:hypothetical protein